MYSILLLLAIPRRVWHCGSPVMVTMRPADEGLAAGPRLPGTLRPRAVHRLSSLGKW